MRILLIAVIILGSAPLSYAASPQAEADPYTYFTQNYPETKWDQTSVRTGDINCDNQTDFALLGREGKRVSVGVLIGPLSREAKVFIIKLQVGLHSQDSLCQLPANLQPESLDYDPSEMLGGPLAGFMRSKVCEGFNVSDGACDSFHFFWNHERQTVQWWRL